VEGQPTPVRRGLSRRRLLAEAGFGALALSLSATIDGIAAAAESLPRPALLPDDPVVRRTISAFADTIVPGPAGGADRRPGAVEAQVLDEIYDPFYGALTTFPIIHNDLLLITPLLLRRPASFELALPYPDRERVLEDRLRSLGDGGRNPLYVIYIGVATLVYLGYYGGAQSPRGPRTIGFPPESDGYWPDHSYRIRFRGMTEDGNPP
jgi:hypothetical protein